MKTSGSLSRRAYQQEALREFVKGKCRWWGLLWERQAGKSSTLAEMSLFKMMKVRNRTCIYASASLLLAREIILKQRQRTDLSARQIIEKEAAVLRAACGRFADKADSAGMKFQINDQESEKDLGLVKPDDFAELFEAQRLEFRVYHDRNSYSRTMAIAPNPATARGWSGTVFLDEISFIADLRELIVAMEPIISTNNDFEAIFSTTPPEFDDTHYSFELLAPPAGTEFKPNAAGNWYESESGVRVHRADAFDTHLAGKKIFDLRSGAEITPDQAFAKALNKDGHRIAHFLAWMIGGAAACDLLRLKVAQERGVGNCRFVQIDSDADLDEALSWLESVLRGPKSNRRIGLGFDVATTTENKSNPSSLAIVEENGPEILLRLSLVWKTRDPDIAEERIGRIVRFVTNLAGRPRALAIDATNEKYFAEAMRKKFRAECPILLVVGSEGVEKPGLDKPTNFKELLGSDYVAKLDDNRLTLPPEQYIRTDHRLVKKDRGKFVCKPDEEGRHGDTFDSGKLGLYAVSNRGGEAKVIPTHIGQPIGSLSS